MIFDPYHLLRPVLAGIDAEISHKHTINALKCISNQKTLLNLSKKLYGNRVPDLPVRLFGRTLKNPVGLAAGFDKDGVAVPAVASLGFGFVEVGTVTPKPQSGNPKPRIFRIESDQSIINRLGFNSSGLDAFCSNAISSRHRMNEAILGVNIGKNTDTPNNRAIEDYLECLEQVYHLADYVVLNLSSPNSPGLVQLQLKSHFKHLLETILQKRDHLASKYQGKTVPIAVKVSPDLNTADLTKVVEIAMALKADAIIATNTTTARTGKCVDSKFSETGGLSGNLLNDLSTHTIKAIAEISHGNIPIIGVGGVSSADDAWSKFVAGATVIQLYSSMVFQGPIIVKQIVEGLIRLLVENNTNNFGDALKIRSL